MRILGISGSLRRESHNSMLLRAAIAEADAVLIATPEYNYSIPGVLKNAIDWASRPSASAVMRNKPAAVVGASTGMFGAVWSQAETRKSLAGAGARVIDRELPVAQADSAFDEAGRLVDDELEALLGGILAELCAAVEARRDALEAAACAGVPA